MKEEIKKLLENELKAVSKSKTSILVGVAMIALDVILVLTSLISFYSLIFILPLILAIRNQLQEYRINLIVLTLARLMVDKEYEATFNTEDNGRI